MRTIILKAQVADGEGVVIEQRCEETGELLCYDMVYLCCGKITSFDICWEHCRKYHSCDTVAHAGDILKKYEGMDE